MYHCWNMPLECDRFCAQSHCTNISRTARAKFQSANTCGIVAVCYSSLGADEGKVHSPSIDVIWSAAPHGNWGLWMCVDGHAASATGWPTRERDCLLHSTTIIQPSAAYSTASHPFFFFILYSARALSSLPRWFRHITRVLWTKRSTSAFIIIIISYSWLLADSVQACDVSEFCVAIRPPVRLDISMRTVVHWQAVSESASIVGSNACYVCFKFISNRQFNLTEDIFVVNTEYIETVRMNYFWAQKYLKLYFGRIADCQLAVVYVAHTADHFQQAAGIQNSRKADIKIKEMLMLKFISSFANEDAKVTGRKKSHPVL